LADKITLQPASYAKTISTNLSGPRGPRGEKGDTGVNSIEEINNVNSSSLAQNYILGYDTVSQDWISQDGTNMFVLLTGTQTVGGNKTFTGAVNFNTSVVSGIDTPLLDNDAANKAYVDANIQGLSVRNSCRVASTANETLTAASSTLDGVTLINGDRALLKNQSTASQNGIYVFTVDSAGQTWVRATDADENAEVIYGIFTFITEGTINANKGFVLSTPDPITLNTTALTFTQFSSAGNFTAGNGLTLTSTVFDVGTASSSRIVVNADNIDLATTGVSAATYQSVTVDVYGRVTAGTNPTTIAGYGITDAILATGTAGFPAKDGGGVINERTITGTVNRIDVTDGDGVSGNPVLDISSTYAGQATITTLGTITTGTWNADVIDLARGGTGINLSTATEGALFKKIGTTFVEAVLGIDYLSSDSTIDGGIY